MEEKYLMRQVTTKQNLAASFNMVMQSWFINSRHFDLLNQAFENENEALFFQLQSYQIHKNFLRLKNDVESVAEEIEA